MSNTNKALLFSLAFHVALLSGLAMLRPGFDPGVGASTRYLEIALVTGPTAPEPSAEAPASDGVAAAAASAAPRRTASTPAADSVDAPSPAPPAPAVIDPPVPDPIEAALADAPMPAPPDPAPAQTPSPAPPVPEPEALSDVPRPAAAPAAAVVVATAPDLPAPDIDAEAPQPVLATSAAEPAADVPAPSLPPVREPLANVEADLLTARIEDWAESFAALGELRTTATWEDRDGVYEATVTHMPGSGETGYDEAIVTVRTTRGGKTLSTRVRMQRLGFSHYAQFIDRWDPDVQIHDDEIDGRFHANSDIAIQRSAGVQPTFLGKVTTARSIDTSRSDRRVDRADVFLGGLETRVGRIPLPPKLTLFADAEPDPAHVVNLAGDTELRFSADGSFSWVPLLSRREQRRIESGKLDAETLPAGGAGRLPPDAPFYFIAAEDSRVHVAGVVDGRVLVYTPDDIVIDDDLVYAKHPSQSVSSDDFLGLVAEGSVEIADADTTGPGNLEVHAAIYARNRFAVRGFLDRPSGELIVIGSITAGSVTATEPRFSTRLAFDRRLADARPPAFPLTDRYEIADWDGAWVVEP